MLKEKVEYMGRFLLTVNHEFQRVKWKDLGD